MYTWTQGLEDGFFFYLMVRAYTVLVIRNSTYDSSLG